MYKVIRAKEMTPEQVTHSFCTWCRYRRYVLGHTYWGCALEGAGEEKLAKLCPYRQAVAREEAAAKEGPGPH